MPEQDTPLVIDALFKTFTAASSDIIHLNDEEGRIIFANQASEDLLGYSDAELLQKPATSLIHPDNLDVIKEDMQEISEKNAPPPREIRLRKKDGDYLDVEVQGFLVPSAQGRFVGAIIRDISGRKAMEEKRIQFTDSVLQSQLFTTLDGILVVAPDNKILLTNKQFHKMWRIDPHVAALHDDAIQIKTVLNQLVDPDAFLAHVQHLYAHPEETSLDVIYLKDDRCFERYSSPLYSTGKEILGRIWYFRDITQAKQQEEERLTMKKLESVGILAGGIAHDFSNLLSAILGNVELSTFYVPKENKAVGLLKAAKKACLHAHVLTQQLITFSKGGAPVKKRERLEKIIRDSCEQALQQSDVKCHFSIADELWPVECDRGQISQVVQNLIVNASQAMPEGGVVDISCTNIHCPGNSTLVEGDYLQLIVADHGIGIPAQNIGNIFDPYFTTRDMGTDKGTGLGLTIVHSIIGKHDGTIDVESVEGEGTTFTILLPADKEKGEGFAENELN